MKKQIILLSALLAVGFSNMNCSSGPEKVQDAQSKVGEANQDLDEANAAYEKEVADYKMEADQRIEANNKSIAEFKARVELQKADARQDYKNKTCKTSLLSRLYKFFLRSRTNEWC
jgi:hypothetical protein